jgi:CheY-like chemotaxis protein
VLDKEDASTGNSPQQNSLDAPISPPMALPRPVVHAGSELLLLAPHSGKRVLFVDDEPLIRKMVSRFLTKLGCVFTVLSDGDEVADALQKQTYDVVMLDIVMQRSNGEDVCAQLRRAYLHLPIIAATANTSSHDQRRYRQAGFDGCLAKPYSIQDVSAVISRWSTGRCAADALLNRNEAMAPRSTAPGEL